MNENVYEGNQQDQSNINNFNHLTSYNNQTTLEITTETPKLIHMRCQFYNKKFATQPDQLQFYVPAVTDNTLKHINVKDIEFDDPAKLEKKIKNHYHLLQRKIKIKPQRIRLNRLDLPNKLPMLIEPPSFSQQVEATNQINKKNGNLLNALIEILKPPNLIENQEPKIQMRSTDHSYRWEQSRKSKNTEGKLLSEFNQVLAQHSAKNHRGPKIIQSEITKLTNQNFLRRRIASEEKCREKFMDEQDDKRKKEQTFENIEILTFSNKFPGLKKRNMSQDDDSNEFMKITASDAGRTHK